MAETAENVFELHPGGAPETAKARRRSWGMIAGIIGGAVVGGVIAETVLPAYVSPIRGRACPSERERNLTEEYRNMRKASKKTARADGLLKKATKKERKGEYDRAERLVTTATDLAADAAQSIRDTDEAAGKRGANNAEVRKTAKTKLDTLRVLKEEGAKHPAEKAEEPKTQPAGFAAPSTGDQTGTSAA